MSSLSNLAESARALASFCITVPWMLPIARARRGPSEPWVIGGHGGRLRADNSAALHDHLLAQGGPDVVFITGNPEVLAQLRARGVAALRRNSFAARWAILKAPVLIYSHGEDDLDVGLLLLRGRLGLRVFLNHSMNYLKAGQHCRPEAASLRGIRRWLFEWLVQDFDALLASSPLEKRYFERSFPGRAEDILLGGGAHIDGYLRERDRPQTRTLVYFPTFRDDARGRRRLERTLRELVTHRSLGRWLQEHDYRLLIGSHVNTGELKIPLPAPMAWMPTSEVKQRLLQCRLFISDYSGLIFDYLALDKPIALFPFDLDSYLRTRRLYSDYADIAYGPVVRSVEALAELIVSGRWEDRAPFADRRQRMFAEVFPESEPRYAQRSFDTIRDLAARFGGNGRGA